MEQNEIKPSNVTDAQVKSVLAELAVELGNAYVLRRLNDKSLDDYRDVVIELFKRKDTLKKADVTNEVLSKKLTTIPQPVYNRVMKEFATTANAVWTLKSGDIDE